MDTTEQNLNQAFDWLQKVGESVQDTAVEQLPLLAQEIVVRAILLNSVTLIAALVVLLASIYYMRRLIKDSIDDGGFCVVVVFIGAGSGLALCHSVYSVCYAIFCPRLVVLDYIKDFIN
jgi:hypothetical protein